MRALRAEDEPLYTHLYTDNETMRFIGAPLSAERASASFRSALAGMARTPIERLFLTVMEQASSSDVGICSLQNFDPQRRSVQAGIMFTAAARAQGYSKESFIGLIPKVFAELPVDELWVQFAAEHLAVERAVTSVGFERRRPDKLQHAPQSDPGKLNVWFVRRDTWLLPASPSG
jgi:RimJ/RimL family protein N-acetyltransferase